MGQTPVRGHFRNGRWVRPYTQWRRSGAGSAAHAGRSPVAVVAGVVATAAFVGVAWILVRGPLHAMTHDRLAEPAPLAGSSWFSTSGVVCEAVGGSHPIVRCAPTSGARLRPAVSNPLCTSRWYGSLVALRSGRSPEWVCPDGPLSAPAGVEVLATGQTTRFGSLDAGILTCQALNNDGVSCHDSRTRYGFEISPTGYRFDDGIFGA